MITVAPNIFKPRNDWNIIALNCKNHVRQYSIFVKNVATIIEKETGYNPMDSTRLRKRAIVEARMLFLVMLCNKNNKSLSYIGSLVGKDHATVIHAKKTVMNLCSTDRQFNELYNQIKNRVDKL